MELDSRCSDSLIPSLYPNRKLIASTFVSDLEPIKKSASGNYGGMENRIKELRKQMGWSLEELAKRCGTTKSTIKKLEDGPKNNGMNLTADWIEKTARAFGVSPVMIIADKAAPQIPIIGRVGAGAEVFPIDDLPLYRQGLNSYSLVYANCKTIDVPNGMSPDSTLALEVEGDSMMPYIPEGSIVFYSNRYTPLDQCYNVPCIVSIKNGATLVKVLKRGYKKDTFNLVSYNAPMIEDVKLNWIAKIRYYDVPENKRN